MIPTEEIEALKARVAELREEMRRWLDELPRRDAAVRALAIEECAKAVELAAEDAQDRAETWIVRRDEQMHDLKHHEALVMLELAANIRALASEVKP